jgi:oligopeptide transport system ATP-binding protein
VSALLTVEDLVVEYPGHTTVRAVDGVSLTIAPGEVLALVGESGCGKSSTARAVVGMERPRAGSVRYRGDVVPPLGLSRRPARFTGIQMVFQDPNSSLNPRKRVGSQVADGIAAARSRGQGSTGTTTASDWLEAVGLHGSMASRYPHQFSGGQRQRIAIARAIAARPDLIVADEPISALDASSQAAVAGLMRQLTLEAGAGMLFISHDLSVVRAVADRTAVMYRGRIVESGRSETVWSDPVHPYTRALLAAIPHPDGRGTMPAAPAVEAPPEWSQHIEEAHHRA